MKKLVVIGGSDAGISGALRAKEVDPQVEVSVVVADQYPNFSICGLPFYLSGEVKDWKTLAHRTAADIEKEGIRLLLNHTAGAIDPDKKQVRLIDKNGNSTALDYDRLLIGTGAVSVEPGIEGLRLPGVFTLRWMDDSFAMQRFLTEQNPKSAIIIGAGYIGMEMADALTYKGLKVTVVEYLDSVLTTVDPELGHLVQAQLERNGVVVNTGVAVEKIERNDKGLTVRGSGGFFAAADTVLVAVGARPESKLAQTAGIETGMNNAIKVNRRMQTSLPDIYAAGDCVETWHKLLQKYTYMPLGSTAHKQGRVAGENIAGGDAVFQGTLGTQAVKIFGMVVAGTGLRDASAREAGFDPLTVETECWDHKVYYPGAHKMRIRMTGDRISRRILGAQIMGHVSSEVSKRVDVVATAIFNELKVEDLNDIDLSYTPPLSSPWDPVQIASQAWCKNNK
ncbi:MAG: FAD-dependent oxidoreductase [Desulfobacteraceae bacterium]|jgi:NADPH-dependent 2,4-dienoyl-CoA reductase/sulfur reductase-like enzyme|nr:FAD-dependent oxidoreductase [Desulfobacteraceae bacterium]